MELLLKARELVDLGDKLCGVGVVCLEGSCWLTQEGDGRDHILHSGNTFTVELCGQVIVTAYTSCRLQMIVARHTEQSIFSSLSNALRKALLLPAFNG